MHDLLALFDIDGVLANETHRQQYALDKDWGMYFYPPLVNSDTVWPQGREMYENAHLVGMDVGYLTGRREDLRQVTMAWLAKHGFDPELPLLMRHHRHQTRNGYPLARLKAGIVAEAVHLYPDGVYLYDDDPAVIAEVAKVPGAFARHCTWHVKPERMVRRGVA